MFVKEALQKQRLSPTRDYSLARHPTILFNKGLRDLFFGELSKLGTIMQLETHPDFLSNDKHFGFRTKGSMIK